MGQGIRAGGEKKGAAKGAKKGTGFHLLYRRNPVPGEPLIIETIGYATADNVIKGEEALAIR
jgi:phage/plasmid primase-like uncharacterized protein